MKGSNKIENEACLKDENQKSHDIAGFHLVLKYSFSVEFRITAV